jgi:hypothetical protein
MRAEWQRAVAFRDSKKGVSVKTPMDVTSRDTPDWRMSAACSRITGCPAASTTRSGFVDMKDEKEVVQGKGEA